MIFRNMKWQGKDIKILGKWLNNLGFIDDIVIAVKNFDEIGKIVRN